MQVLLDYGAYTAGRFLYQYGWLPGGDATPAGATSPHDEPVLVLRRCRGRARMRVRMCMSVGVSMGVSMGVGMRMSMSMSVCA